MGRRFASDGTSRALGATAPLSPDPTLAEALLAAAGGRARSGVIVSTDLFYDVPEAEQRSWIEAGAQAVEMETATLFALAERRLLEAASLLLVSDLLLHTRKRISAEQLHAAEHRLGELAVEAFARRP